MRKLTLAIFLSLAARAAQPTITATAKGPNQINLTWPAAANPGYGYLVEIQSVTDTRYSAWTELQPIPVASGYAGDPTGQHVYNPALNTLATWVTEPQFTDPQDGTPAQFIATGLLPATTYRFRVRTHTWATFPAYSRYSDSVAATTAAYPQLYVSPTGNDSNAGTKAAPFLTLAKAGAALACGQVLMVAGGDYLNDHLALAQNCTPASKAVVLVNPGDTATIAGPASSGPAIVLSGSNVVVDGLIDRTAATDYQVLVAGSRNALFNLETAGSYGGVHLVHADHALIYHSYLHDGGNPAVDNGGGGFVLAVEQSAENVIWSNHLTRGSHDVSLCKSTCTHSRWLNNVMDGGWGMGFEAIENSTGNLIEGNLIYHVQQLIGATYKPSIEISSASNTVRRNLILGGASFAIEISALYGGDTARAVLVYNNTLAGNKSCLFESANDGGGLGDSAYDGVVFANNICSGFTGNATDIYRANVQSQIANNAFFGTLKSVIWAHRLAGNYQYPRAVDDADTVYAPPFSGNVTMPARFTETGDYHLNPLSPLTGMAAAVADPVWPVAPATDLGAFGIGSIPVLLSKQ